jgi:hypothetical protein
MIKTFKKIWEEIFSKEQPENFQTYPGVDGPIIILGGEPTTTIIIETDKESKDLNLK